MDTAHTHAVLRFAFGVTLAFVVAELMEWTPPFLSPVLTCVVLANIPVRPPLKVALGFTPGHRRVSVPRTVALLALRGAPHILFGLSTLIVFLALHALAKGASRLAPLFIIICTTAIPVVGMSVSGRRTTLCRRVCERRLLRDLHGLGELAALSEGAATARGSQGRPVTARARASLSRCWARPFSRHSCSPT